jgi:hypothetical protein
VDPSGSIITRYTMLQLHNRDVKAWKVFAELNTIFTQIPFSFLIYHLNNGSCLIITQMQAHSTQVFSWKMKLLKKGCLLHSVILYSGNYGLCWCLHLAAQAGKKSIYKLIMPYKPYEHQSLKQCSLNCNCSTQYRKSPITTHKI